MAFAFSNGPTFTVGEGNPPTYENAGEMWRKRARIDSIAGKVRNRVKGNAGDAKKIENFLNDANKVLRSKSELTETKILTQQLMRDLIEKSGLNDSSTIVPGTDFEVWVDKIFQFAMTGKINGTLFRVGDKEDTTVGVYGKLENIKFGGATGFQSKAGRKLIGKFAKQYSTPKQTAAALEKDIKDQVAEDLGNATYYIEQGVNDFKNLYIYSTLVQGKTDINTTIQINQELSEEYGKIPQLLANHTFSLKNYGNITSVHIGDATRNRALFGFYYFATNDSRVNNASRFVFSSKNSSNVDVKTSYLTWAEALYELAGLGQVQFQFNDTKIVDLRLVDYLVVQFRGLEENNIRVYSVKEFLEGAPRTPPKWYSNGEIKQAFFSGAI